MAWLSVQLSLPAARIDALGDALVEVGAQAITLRDAADAPVLEPAPGETPMWPQAELDALFPLDVDLAAVRARLQIELGAEFEHTPLDLRFIEDSDWSRTWRDHAVEYRFGDRLWVVPRDADPPNQAGVVLRLDPGLAFGTGGHPTTALCLDWLASHAIDGWSVIDYGSGSGILGIAALLLGAARVIAVDHDDQARLATLANATYNGLAGGPDNRPTVGKRFDDGTTSRRFEVLAPEQLATQSNDLVLANILAGPLVALASQLTGLVRPGGVIVMSGMLTHQLDGVLAAYPEFRFARAFERDSWIMVEGTRAGG
jgi:ribosomal protein L11 methyltransferase